MTRRKTIPLSPDEDSLLRYLYRQYRIPIEQFLQRPNDLSEFVELWNRATSRNDTADELIHYMMTRRKDSRRGGWVTFKGKHQRVRSPGNSVLTPDEWSYIVDILQERRVTADNLATDHSLAQELNKRFALKFGRTIPISLLVASVIAKRKRGTLPKLGRKDDDQDMGFRDIDAV